MPLSNELRMHIENLVSLHGEDGLCPSRADWVAMLSCPADKPLNILNLLRFKEAVTTSDGARTGFAAYGSYSAGVAPAFERVGGKTLYFGKVNHILVMVQFERRLLQNSCTRRINP